MNKNRGPLVEVELEVGRVALMHKRDAQALGIAILPPLVPPSRAAARRARSKARRPANDKARRPANDKARRPANDKARRPVDDKKRQPANDKGKQEINEVSTRVLTEAEAVGIADDFTTIDGIGETRAELLRERGYLTFGDLRFMIDEELEELPARVRQAIRRWRDGQ